MFDIKNTDQKTYNKKFPKKIIILNTIRIDILAD